MHSSDKNSSISEEKFDEKLDTLLTTVNSLVTTVNSICGQISIIDQRIAVLEGFSHREIATVAVSDSREPRATPQVNFDNKDEMLKRAYDVLAQAPRPLTTQEVADRIGRSRSTTSQYLNELHQRNLLLKTYGTTPDKSRNVVFRPVNQNEDEI